jgi:hypothetical protein
MLTKLYKKANIGISEWSEMILEAQWKNASEAEYEQKRKQLTELSEE